MKTKIFLVATLFGVLALAGSKEMIAEIDKNVCSAEPSIVNHGTEAEGICLDCIYGTQSTPPIPQKLKGVDLVLKKQELDRARTELDLKFYQLLLEKGLLSNPLQNGYTEESLKFQIQSYENSIASNNKQIATLQFMLKNKDQFKADVKVFNEEGKLQGFAKQVLSMAMEDAKIQMQVAIKSSGEYVEKNKKLAEESTDAAQKQSYQTLVNSLESSMETLKKNDQNLQSAMEWVAKGGGQPVDPNVVSYMTYQSGLVDGAAEQILNYQKSTNSYNEELLKYKALLEGMVPEGGELSEEQKIKKTGQLEKRARSYEYLIKSNGAYKECGLTVAEKAAIYNFSSSSYFWINKALMAGGEEAKKVTPFVEVLNSALRKLKKVEGPVHRTLFVADADLMTQTPGALISSEAFTTSSLKEGKVAGKTNYIIQSKTGRYISGHSVLPAEAEVVFAPRTQFRVLSVEGKDIVLEEVAP